MARKCLVTRNNKRAELYTKYKKQREYYKQMIKKAKTDPEAAKNALKYVISLSRLPRNSSPIRQRNRCLMTGRSRGMVHYRRFGLCSFQLRQAITNNDVFGVYKE